MYALSRGVHKVHISFRDAANGSTMKEQYTDVNIFAASAKKHTLLAIYSSGISEKTTRIFPPTNFK
jgi:hypothetical protein